MANERQIKSCILIMVYWKGIRFIDIINLISRGYY